MYFSPHGVVLVRARCLAVPMLVCYRHTSPGPLSFTLYKMFCSFEFSEGLLPSFNTLSSHARFNPSTRDACPFLNHGAHACSLASKLVKAELARYKKKKDSNMTAKLGT